MSKALYRKWRPQTFDDVVGQEHITTTLKHQVQSGKPSHAYLFCGSRGTGKTSCSKIMAKAVNCTDSIDGNPCGKCDNCIGIENENLLDVTEIDAASNSGVDNIRDLREEANFTPVQGKYRVYIIDETHMLSPGAFNALLKIMEEPPPHVIFILATTEKHKVPATILSRCQRYDFNRISSEVIAAQLLHIAAEEKVELKLDAAALIAKLSDGGMRDAISLLDLSISTADEITIETVQSLAGLADNRYLYEIIGYSADGDFVSSLKSLSELWGKSLDPQQFAGQLLDAYRNLLIAKTISPNDDLLQITPLEAESLEKVTESYTTERILYSMETISDYIGRMSRTTMKRAELETCLLKLSKPELSALNSGIITRLEKIESRIKSGAVSTAVPVSPESTPPSSAVVPNDSTPAPMVPETVADLTLAEPFDDWNDTLDVLKHQNAALYGTLLTSKAYVVDDLLLVDAGSDLFSQMVRSDDYAKNSLRDAAFKITGKTYRLGPYQKEKYTTAPETNTLDKLLETAEEIGVKIEIKENE